MKVFAENRKARNSYEFSEYIEAGIVLTGSETKSIRNGGVSIVDAFAVIENEEAIIREMNIEQYKFSNELDYNAKSPRKLLLHKKEIKRLIGLTSIKGNTLVAMKVYEKNGFIKIELALGKGRKDYDKRKKLTEKQHKKDMKNY
ncbi:SsrA-binding protein SmpB [Candidatus Actinomarina sp.]|jgi:SsrA-binding protein|nr:SsrA-binding protein SmpB [Acidimicrobiaceae bacterium]MDA8564374.1 SsrA-binding protein SmpB [bacterium]MDA8653080.1 SsrA-binding protein SmpB [Candidatus Actinomarina sp.]MDA9017577.1 SsrA-binding protein SmpB [Acidimicrobiia bacterium]MDA8709932.1 SsrA-binding protein SmpB [Candidatus Actinomarina sp.]|tara:strand:- start:5997 stop:6428 length:432 start_codon:yes stop_codon:yes gene_type:complete